MRNDLAPRLGPRFVIGTIVIALGILWTLDNLRILDAGDLWRWWPVVIIAIGLVRAMESRGRVSGSIITGIGIVLLFGQLELFDFDLWDLWPLALVAVGLGMVWGALRRQRDHRTGRAGTGAAGGAADAWIRAVAILGSSNRSSGSQEFRGGDLTAVLGGCEIDLRNASLLGGEAVIDVFVLCGGIDIRIPQDWTVVGETTALLAGIEDKTRKPATATKRLVVKGLVILGGVEISN